MLSRILKGLALVVVGSIGLVAVLEVAFRVGGLGLAAAPRPAPDGSTVVLCVGDSHTRGQLDPDNYPAQLERILNERAGGHYRVINVGVPGLNTAQVRKRFERYVGYYRPAIVLHWAGINNFWNYAEDDVRQPAWTDWLVESSRLARFVRVAFFYRRLNQQVLEKPVLDLHGWPGPDSKFVAKFAGTEEEVIDKPGDPVSEEQIEKVTRGDLTAMMQIAWERRIPMFLVVYPLAGAYYRPVNRAVRGVSDDFGVPFVDSFAAIEPAKQEANGAPLFDSWVHPTPVLYRQIAEQAYGTLVAQGVVHESAVAGAAAARD
jgi:lysophospholipase L1-like esterase